MLALNNILSNLLDFYNGLESDSKFVFVIVAVLILIVLILIIVLIEQMHLSKRALKTVQIPKNTVPDKEEDKTEILDLLEDDVDDDNEKTRNLKEISQKIKEVIDNRGNGIANYEQEQEETSIISYEELLKAAGKSKPEPVSVPIQERFDTPVAISHKIEESGLTEKKEPIVEKPREDGRFKTSDFISPIYGIQNKSIESQIEEERPEPIEYTFENTEEIVLDNRGVSNGITYNEEKFLSTLKKLRNDLD